MKQLTVSRLANQVGTSPDTLRYYERIGLLPAPERSASGYRLYDGSAVDRVNFIKRAQRFGLRLDDIRELLEIKERGLCPCGHTRALLETRVAHLDEERAALGRLRDEIQHMLDDGPPVGTDGWRGADDLLQIRPTARSTRRPPAPTKGGER